MKEVYTISEAAALYNVTSQTLRHYDRIGLLKPTVKDKGNGYRMYGNSEMRKLYVIKELKAMGMSLDEIKSYCDTKNITLLEDILRRNNTELEKEIRRLTLIKERTEDYLSKLERGKLKYSDACEIREIGERYVYFIEMDFEIKNLEAYIQILNNSYTVSISPHEQPGRGRIMLSMSEEKLQAGQFKIYNGLGFLLGSPMEGKHSKTLARGRFAVAYHLGSYDTIHNVYKRLHKYIGQSGLSIAGDAVEVSITDIAFTDDPDKFITEVQIPV